MRRSVSIKIATFVLVIATSLPAIAAPRVRIDSPFDRWERAITRIVNHLKKIIHPIVPLDEIQVPK